MTGRFSRIARNGFGDPLNAYAHTMAWFDGHLYVGTMRANLHLLSRRRPFPTTVWPVPRPEDVYDLDLRAQIWRLGPTSSVRSTAGQRAINEARSSGRTWSAAVVTAARRRRPVPGSCSPRAAARPCSRRPRT